MPYYKQQRRVKSYRRRSAKKNPPSRMEVYGAAGRQLFRDVQKLKNLINVEFKYHDVQFAQDAHLTGAVVPLNLVPLGDGATARDGNQFRMKSIQIKGNCKNKTASTSVIFSRIDLILDNDPNGSTPVLTDIYDTTGAVPYYRALRNLDNRNRFITLKSWEFKHDPNGDESYIINYYKDIDIKTLFTGTTATIANLKNNHLFLAITGSNASGSGNEGVVECQTRIRYVDN